MMNRVRILRKSDLFFQQSRLKCMPHARGGEPAQCLKYKIPQPKLEDFDSQPLKGAIFFEFLGCLRRLELADNVGLTYHLHTAV